MSIRLIYRITFIIIMLKEAIAQLQQQLIIKNEILDIKCKLSQSTWRIDAR